ncbi:hypothetical protein [Nocardiopsis sp. LOL_012]|uniref:hypothetical protein n=1 Tax=Nocardiopsis sp. LOL_012 TaxID=3345409 RepID=UPI003A883F76
MPKRKNSSNKRNSKRDRRFVVRGERRDPPDVRKLGRALLSLAQAEAERQAEADHEARNEQREEGRDAESGS